MTLTKEKRYQIVVHLESKNEYIRQFKAALDKEGSERLTLMTYLNSQFQKLDHLIEAISQETFWQVFPEILGVDAKLTLLTELISFEDFSNEEIIRIVENDYQVYFKELCGYDLKMKEKPSIIFHIL
ncbi:DUF7006 family protein [Enterococcus sp. PF-3]|uniref:DUF7006 family protein n=1 Tax=Enterococcus sp. PF-3 TaxID=2585144 RepID=UPI0021597CAA|nr:hypothetical protein [Enterococcus sp. PF-3]